MKAYRSTLFFLVLLLFVTLLSQGSRALVDASKGSECKEVLAQAVSGISDVRDYVEGKYALDCKEPNQVGVTTRYKNLSHLEACVLAYENVAGNARCWCRMY